MDVVYNATNNELVRTKTLVKNAIVLIDATPFKMWYIKHYGTEIGKKKAVVEGEEPAAVVKKSKHVIAKQKGNAKGQKLEQHLIDQFTSGRLMACISSRPGQSGRCDGYIVEGKELEFYAKKTEKKK